MERRFLALQSGPVKVHTRADGDTELSTIEGYAAVFYRDGDPGTEFWLYDDMVERILPGAFDNAIADNDVRALFNHNPSFLLGRNLAQTLRLSVDTVGLRYEIDAPNTQVGRDVLESIRRQDLSGSSFAFLPTKRTWREEVREINGQRTTLYIREIEQVQLFDVGPVTYPAYQSTSTGVRSAGDLSNARKDLDAHHAQRSNVKARQLAYATRARLCEIGL